MSVLDYLNIAGFAVGIIGLLIAIWQTISARKTREMYREKCKTRCKDLVETVEGLDRAVIQACRIKDEKIDDLIAFEAGSGKAIRPLRQLSDQIHSIYVSKNQLVRFCERLNDEHEEEFGHPVYENIRGEFVDFPIQITESGQGQLNSTVEFNGGADNQRSASAT